MTEDQIHEWVKAQPIRFVAGFRGRVFQARRMEEKRHNPLPATKEEARKLLGDYFRAERIAMEFLLGGLESHGINPHTDVLNLYMAQVIAGDRAVAVP